MSLSVSKSTSIPRIISKEKLAGLFAILLGSAIIFMVGFSNIDAVHNAAHDTRHSFSFPCH